MSEPRQSVLDSVKEHLPNPTESIIDQIVHIFVQWYNRRVLLLSSIIMLTMPNHMLVIGSVF